MTYDEKVEYRKCPVCGMMAPLTLGKITMHGDENGICLGSEIGCLSPKNIEDIKKDATLKKLV